MRAIVRDSAPIFPLTLLIARPILALSSFVRAEEFMFVGYKRRENDGGEQSQFTPSTSEAGKPQTIPFAQRLTTAINDAGEVSGLGRTKLCELIGAGHLVTTTVGCRRLVVVRSLLSLLETSIDGWRCDL